MKWVILSLQLWIWNVSIFLFWLCILHNIKTVYCYYVLVKQIVNSSRILPRKKKLNPRYTQTKSWYVCTIWKQFFQIFPARSHWVQSINHPTCHQAKHREAVATHSYIFGNISSADNYTIVGSGSTLPQKIVPIEKRRRKFYDLLDAIFVCFTSRGNFCSKFGSAHVEPLNRHHNLRWYEIWY